MRAGCHHARPDPHILLMSDINLPVKWNESFELPYEGLYFIAVRYPNGFGAYDFSVWNGQTWELGYDAEVVGWVTLNEILSAIKAGWPAGDNKTSEEFAKSYLARKDNRQKTDDDDDFVEVKDL